MEVLMREGRLMNIESPAIPYVFADLEPAMSRDALVFHFSRHQRVCFDRMLTMARGSELEALPLDELIRVTERNPAHHVLYRYAAEVWNHNLFWRSMRPRGGGAAHGVDGEHIRTEFGCAQAVEIVATSNAGTPLVRGDTAILALDLWEHAYYLDHQNRRAAYVTAFLEELVNWDFASRTLAGLGVNPDPRASRVRPVTETERARLSVR